MVIELLLVAMLVAMCGLYLAALLRPNQTVAPEPVRVRSNARRQRR